MMAAACRPGSLPGGIGLENCRSRLQTLYGDECVRAINREPTHRRRNRDRLAAVADRMTLRIVIVDDEPPARARLRRLLKAASTTLEIVAECGDGATAVQVIEAESPDLVLLDVQMPELDGFEVLRTLDVPKMPDVIFVTAFDKYAVRAFEVHALDYVVKPVEQDRFDHALVRARQHLSEQRDAIAGLLRDLARERAYLTRMPGAQRRPGQGDRSGGRGLAGRRRQLRHHSRRRARISGARHDRRGRTAAGSGAVRFACIDRPSSASIASRSSCPICMATFGSA